MSYLITFLPRGQGRFRFLPLGPLATPITPLKRSLREGYGTVRRVYTAPKSCPHEMGKVAWRSHDERGTAQSCQVPRGVPPSDNPPKLSPGWNKVALLTFVRNSPCSCPFSVSLHPPQAALNSKPRKRWRLLVDDIQKTGDAPSRPPVSFSPLPYPLCLSIPLASSSSSFAAGSFTLARNIMAAIMYGLKLACL